MVLGSESVSYTHLSLMMDDKFHLALHDNQDGENADNDQPYTIRDCIDFCQEMNSELLLGTIDHEVQQNQHQSQCCLLYTSE